MLLAIDTSTRYGGVGLWRDDRAIGTLCWYSRQNHTAELLPAIDHILDRVKMDANGIAGVAVALGPGGFSAIRVGISAAKGLALPLQVPLVGIGTLEIEAYPYSSLTLPICPLLDAGRAGVATALFQTSRGRWKKLLEERVCTPEEVVESISKRTLLCGEGAPLRREYFQNALGRKGVVLGFHSPASRLWALAALAGDRLNKGAVDDVTELQPLYLRRPSIGPPKAAQRVSQ